MLEFYFCNERNKFVSLPLIVSTMFVFRSVQTKSELYIMFEINF